LAFISLTYKLAILRRFALLLDSCWELCHLSVISKSCCSNRW